MNEFAVDHDMQVAAELIADGLNHFGMAMADMADAHTRDQVKVSAPFRRVQVRTFGPRYG